MTHLRSHCHTKLGVFGTGCRPSFAYFLLVTNFVFYGGGGGDDLRAVLDCARDNPNLRGVSKNHLLRKNIESVVAKSGLSLEAVVSAIAKVRIEERRTGIDQPDLELVHALGEIDGYAHRPHPALMAAAKLLRGRVWDACSLAVEGAVLDQYETTDAFSAHLSRLRAKKKRIDARGVTELFESVHDQQVEDELLSIAGFLERKELPAGLGRMELKMSVASISFSEIEQFKDDVASLESAFLRWKEKSGLKEANRRLAHFQYLALRECRAAERQAENSGVPYGREMVRIAKRRLSDASVTDVGSMFGCRAEHLVGAAGLITDECKIWWGPRIAAEGDDGSSS